MIVTMAELNGLNDEAFITTLGTVFEHSPWIPAAILPWRPFASLEALESALTEVVEQASPEDQLALICAHPGWWQTYTEGRAATGSRVDPDGDWLQRPSLSPDQFVEVAALSGHYQERFGFPFILAEAEPSGAGVIAVLQRRLGADRDGELIESLRQIEHLARRRLRQRVGQRR